MKKSKGIYVVLLLPALWFTACSTEGGAPADPPEESVVHVAPQVEDAALSPSSSEPLLLILGGTFSTARGLPPEQGYGALLQQYLTNSEAPVAVLNASIADETAAGTAERLRYLLIHPVKQVVLELGQADERRQTPPRDFARNVRKLLRHIRTQHPRVPILILDSARGEAYHEALSAAAGPVKGARLSAVLLETGSAIRSDDAALHHRLAEELWAWYGKGEGQ